MKTKILAGLFLSVALLLGRAQTIYVIDVATPSIYNGQSILGDPAPLAFGKVNTNFALIVLRINGITNDIGTNFAQFRSTNTLFSGLIFTNTMLITNLNWVLTNFMSTNIPGTTVLNFDSGNITSDGSGNATFVTISGGLKDGGASTGTSEYVPIANGSGGWTWSARDVIADTGGNGGTCVHVKASDNGTDMYIHVNSSSNITATASP